MNMIDEDVGVDETCATLLEDYGFEASTESSGAEELSKLDSISRARD